MACEFGSKKILAAVRTLIAELAPHAPDSEGIVMCSQMRGIVLMNGRHSRDGNPGKESK